MSLELSSAGRYEILEKIGAGGMGSVYRAKDPVIGRAVAVKAIAFADVPDPKERREMQIRTAREARSAGMLSHPNIVTVHDIGQESGLAYIVMELVEGCTLWELFCKKGRLGKSEFLNILRQSAAALDYAHKHGVIHRDVKPSNILVRADGVAKLTDFGVAKILAAEQLTRTGLVVGTPNYMAPEQIKEQNVTAASDQFGLAVIAYELLTGVKPFDGGTFSSLLFKIMSEPPRRPSELNPRLPITVESVLSKALAKEPESRYASCGEFVAALEEACAALPEDSLGERKQPEEVATPESSESSVARLSLDQLRKVESTRATSFQAPAAPEPQRKSRRTLVIAGMAGAAVLITLIVGLSLTGRDDGEQQGVNTTPSAVVETPSAQPPATTAETPAQTTPQQDAIPTQPAATPGTPVAQSAQPKASQANPPPATAATQPAGAATALDAPLLVGATTTIVWRGQLDTGAELRIDGDTTSVGEISRGLPGGPIQIEVSPNVLEILEAPSEANGWKRLRLRNGGDSPRRYFLIRCRAL